MKFPKVAIWVAWGFKLGQIKEIPCGHSRGHISFLIELERDQNVFLDKFLEEFEFRSSGFLNYVSKSEKRNTL